MPFKDGKPVFSANPGLKELQAIFEQTLTRRNTWIAYAQRLDRLIEFFGKDAKPQSIYRANVAQFREWLRTKYNLKDISILCYVRTASAFFTWMQYYEIIEPDYNPFKANLTRTKPYEYVTGELRPPK